MKKKRRFAAASKEQRTSKEKGSLAGRNILAGKAFLTAFLLTGTCILTGCGAVSQGISALTGSSSESDGETASGAAGGNVTGAQSLADTSDMFTERDMETTYDEENAVSIELNGDSAVCESDSVQIAESTVSIVEEGTYILSGALDDGMLIVDADDTDKVQIVLNGAQITSSSSAAVYVLSADKVFITTAVGTENTLANGGEYVAIDDNNIDAAVFSKSDLTLNGEGSLCVSAAVGHGIVSKDDLVLTSGTYEITAASHGLSGKDSVRIAGGSYTIQSGKDGIHAENADDASLGFVYIADGTFAITAEGDGMSAAGYLQADGGDYTITAGGGAGEQNLGGEAAPEMAGDMLQGGVVQPGAAGEMPLDDGTQPGTTGEMPSDIGQQPGAAGEMPSDIGQQPDMAEGTQPDTESSTEDSTSMKGMKSSTELLLNGGAYVLNCADDALHSNGNLTVNNGSFEIQTGDDGIHADNAVVIMDCDMEILQSYEGIEGLSIDIAGGEIALTASDDGLNAAGGNDSSGTGGRGDDIFAVTEGAYICISGGTLNINAYGDGIDSNGDLTVSGGKTYVSGPVNGGNSSLDYAGEAMITGGIFVAAGASEMAQNFGESSTQAVMMVNVSGGEAGSTITLADSDGRELLSWHAEKAYSSVIVSCPELVQGETYTLTTGEAETTVTMDSLVYGSAGIGGGINGNMNGRMGGEMGGTADGAADMPGGVSGGTPPTGR